MEGNKVKMEGIYFKIELFSGKWQKGSVLAWSLVLWFHVEDLFHFFVASRDACIANVWEEVGGIKH